MSLTVTVQKGHDFSTGNVTRAALNNGATPTVAVTGSVTATEIADGAINTLKLAADSVTQTILKDDTATGSPAAAVTTDHIVGDAVTLAKLANESVVAENLITKKNDDGNNNIIKGMASELTAVAVDDYVLVHDTSEDDALDDTVQLKKAKVSALQKVGTTEYAVSAITVGGTTPSYTVTVDMDGSPFQTVTFSDPVGFYNVVLSNQPTTTLKTVTLKIICATGAGTSANFGLDGGDNFNNGWKWPERGSNIGPDIIAHDRVALLSLTAFGSTSSDVIGAYAVTLA
jgi:hypothetical protein